MNEFIEKRTWMLSLKPSYVYQIDYPVFHPKEPGVIQYGVLFYRLIIMPEADAKEFPSPELLDLGRYGDLGSAQAAIEKHAAENP